MSEQDFEIGGTSSKQEQPSALQFSRNHRECYADFRCDLAAAFFAAVSFVSFLPSMGISISFWPAAAFLDFLPRFRGEKYEDLFAAQEPAARCTNLEARRPSSEPRQPSHGRRGSSLGITV
jgi:hypothetical protein